MSAPLLGHLDPAFVAMMEDVKALLRLVYATGNTLTFPVSGTGAPAWRPASSIWSSPVTR
jgi:alanine-glyoxylate transaminase/serine-glyoxylate transaminase/serine-pyruvate transaminase